MGRIDISENASLDGVFEDPTGDEKSPTGAWFGRTSERDREAWVEVRFAEAVASDALLLGRRS